MRWPFGRRKSGRVVFIGGDPYPSSHPSPLPPAPRPAIRLGFADGSEVALAADDPAAQALRDAADLLAVRRDGQHESRSRGQTGPFS